VLFNCIKQPHLLQRCVLGLKAGQVLQIASLCSISSLSLLGLLGSNRSKNVTSPIKKLYHTKVLHSCMCHAEVVGRVFRYSLFRRAFLKIEKQNIYALKYLDVGQAYQPPLAKTFYFCRDFLADKNFLFDILQNH